MDFGIEFDFTGANTTYLTHSFHPYPAKFPPQLPHNILAKYAKEGDVIFDPFCGSGTTLVEARLLGYDAVGVDVNGLSVLLSQVKCTPLNSEEISVSSDFIKKIEYSIVQWSQNRPVIECKDFEGRDHWFQQNVSEELTFLLNAINAIENDAVRNFFRIVFSSNIVKVSNQESDTRFAAKNKNIPDNFTLDCFVKKAKDYLKRIEEFSRVLPNKGNLSVINGDSRNLHFLKDESVDMIITSPPYANTYDYYLYHKFRKRWLDIDVKYAQNNEIGSRREYSSLKRPAEQWSLDLKLCFAEMYRVLKEGGLAFIVIGDSVINKELVKADDLIRQFIPNVGFECRNIISTSLSSHSRMFNPTFTQKNKQEHLIILQK